MLPQTLSWFESKFPYYNKTFVSSIIHLSLGAFRCKFLNYECHNESYQIHFYNSFIGRAHCKYQCDICSEKDNIHNSKVTTALHKFRSSYSSTDTFRFQPFVRDFETDHFLTGTINSPSVQLHECSFCCTLPVVCQPHFYTFTYKFMLEYAYYHNLSSTNIFFKNVIFDTMRCIMRYFKLKKKS